MLCEGKGTRYSMLAASKLKQDALLACTQLMLQHSSGDATSLNSKIFVASEKQKKAEAMMMHGAAAYQLG